MGEAYFTVEIAHDSDPGRVVASGELDAASAHQLAEVLAQAHAADAAAPLDLDLEAVSFIDSSGLRVIAQEVHAAAGAGRAFTISRASDPVRRIFAMTGLEGLLAPTA